jgi:hypothetical protein
MGSLPDRTSSVETLYDNRPAIPATTRVSTPPPWNALKGGSELVTGAQVTNNLPLFLCLLIRNYVSLGLT